MDIITTLLIRVFNSYLHEAGLSIENHAVSGPSLVFSLNRDPSSEEAYVLTEKLNHALAWMVMGQPEYTYMPEASAKFRAGSLIVAAHGTESLQELLTPYSYMIAQYH